MIVKLALLEFDYVHPERSKTIFKKVFHNYPKRTDIWFRYLDAFLKRSRHQEARQVLDEMSTIKFDKKFRRLVYKRMVDFEVKHGKFENLQVIKSKFAGIIPESADE
ncbi:unnamed protein product [Gordionus sp. m RMFG-2023]